MRYFQYCPDCNLESVENTDKELRSNRVGTDGYGQMVKFTECECGGVNKGYLYVDPYIKGEGEADKGLLEYLKHRIQHYL